MKLHAQNQLYTSISFWDLKVLIASLGMSWDTWPTHVKFATLIDTYLHAKNQLYTSSSFWDIKILKSYNLIVQEHFCIFPIFADFPQTCGFNRIIRVVMVHDLNSKNLRITGLYFFCKIKKAQFWGCFGALSPKWDFFPKIRLRQYFTLKAPKLHENIMKNPMSRFGENIFTYWHTDSGPLFA